MRTVLLIVSFSCAAQAGAINGYWLVTASSHDFTGSPSTRLTPQ